MSSDNGMAGRRLGVVVVDPLGVVRWGLAMIVEREPDLELLGHAANADDAIAILRKPHRGDVAVIVGLDLAGRRDAFWLIGALRARIPACSIVAAGANSDRATIARSLSAGAHGFVDKSTEAAGFVAALKSAASRPTVAADPAHLLAPHRGRVNPTRPGSALTPRERQVLTIAVEGLTARQIGERLGLRERTVTTHLARIYGKLGVNTRVGAVTAAARKGLVTVDAAV